jgi:hypothetical protein
MYTPPCPILRSITDHKSVYGGEASDKDDGALYHDVRWRPVVAADACGGGPLAAVGAGDRSGDSGSARSGGEPAGEHASAVAGVRSVAMVERGECGGLARVAATEQGRWWKKRALVAE